MVETFASVAADETLLGTAREAIRRSLAWASIVDDRRLQDQLTQAQGADARDKAKTSREGAAKAVRLGWSHVLFPVKTENTAAGAAFDSTTYRFRRRIAPPSQPPFTIRRKATASPERSSGRMLFGFT
jgi:hypothetical protein